ncbi:glycerol-3-phosphate acyltransferase [Baia soyae]|uniref:Glycerol-3-phosphate acyltransferase PlsY n=1 Tax=Baia soyae TaxID=1544746 RepID=A0A4R2RT14_9BACL|nr:glycerol-3-phosphate acyltransferase [Baia soyae]TCP66493.1 glycerol-3-phosphate acyltransferase PlsY [Baia soyae]
MGFLFCAIMAYLIGSLSPKWCIQICSVRYPTRVAWILLDIVRGLVAVGIGLIFAGWMGAWAALIFAVLGTWYPFYPSIRPGEGIWICVGGLIVLSPFLLVVGGLIFVVSLFLTRFTFLSTWLAIAGICFLSLFFVSQISVWLILFGLGAGCIYQQKDHWIRFQKGMEPKIKPPYKLF